MNYLDLSIFVAYMAILVGIGAWFTQKEAGLKEYLLAGQDVHWIIVGISVLAALFSGITYIGAPAESFFNDLTILWGVSSFIIATPITTILFLPFFRSLGLYTAYEYLEKRFDRRLRWFASGCFIVRGGFYLALAISAPAIVVSEMTGWSFTGCAIGAGIAATLYTTLGGMKAVIWTDTIQFIVLCGGIVLIIVYAAMKVPGNIAGALTLAAHDHKTDFLKFSLDPTIRVTAWSALIGGVCNNLVQLVTDQISVQRYLTSRSLDEAKRALWLKLWLTLPLVGTFYLSGSVLYGYYKANPDRVPVFENAKLVPGLATPAAATGPSKDETSITAAANKPPLNAGEMEPGPEPAEVGKVSTPPLKNDRLLPYFVMHELPSPLPGLLIAAIVGATMAVISAGINALATTALIDISSLFSVEESKRVLAARFLTLAFGALATAGALQIGRLGTMFEATNKIMGLFGGPLLGVFFLGVLTRRPNGTAALLGALAGAVTGAVIAFSGTLFQMDPAISFFWITPAAVLVTFGVGIAAARMLPPAVDVEKYVFRGRVT